MDYKTFCDILNEQIFDNSKKDLLVKVAKYPDRYVGLFRPTKPKAKVLQNMLQSHEIRFGDALEILFEKEFELLGFENLDKRISKNDETLDLDQLFKDKHKIYFIEQKVRDDHDSTKKRGQISNFEKKIVALLDSYNETDLLCFMYFIDPSLDKNMNYYKAEIDKMKQAYNVSIKLVYGKELWDEINHSEFWNDLLKFLEDWKKGIPEMPSVNFDEEPEKTFEEIKDVNISDFRRLFENKIICKEIIPILFPQKKVLRLLYKYFIENGEKKTIYVNLAKRVKELIG